MFNYTAYINASVVHWYLDEERDKQHTARGKTSPESILFLHETGKKKNTSSIACAIIILVEVCNIFSLVFSVRIKLIILKIIS